MESVVRHNCASADFHLMLNRTKLIWRNEACQINVAKLNAKWFSYLRIEIHLNAFEALAFINKKGSIYG